MKRHTSRVRTLVGTAAAAAVAMAGLVGVAGPASAGTGPQPWTCIMEMQIDLDTDIPAEVEAGADVAGSELSAKVPLPEMIIGMLRGGGADAIRGSADVGVTIAGHAQVLQATFPETALPASGGLDMEVTTVIPTFAAPLENFTVLADSLSLKVESRKDGTWQPLPAPFTTITCEKPATLPPVDSVTVTGDQAKTVTTTTLALAPAEAAYGTAVNATATVSAVEGSATGDVKFTWKGGSSTVALANGKATLAVKDLPVGTHEIEATYAGTDAFASSSAKGSVKITPAASSTTLADVTVDYGTDAVLSSVVTVASGAAAGDVTFSWAGGSKKVAVVGGKATASVSGLAAGVHEVKALFTPTDTNFAQSEAKAKVTVEKAATTTTVKAKPKKLKVRKKATLQISVASGALAADGTVTVTVKGKNLGKKKSVVKTVTLKNGKATLKTPKATSAGKVKVKVAYAGSANFAASSASKLVITVK